jgi:hypothetical protein
MLRFSELEAALQSPSVARNLVMAEGLAMYIARSAPNGHVANLAMRVMSELGQLRSTPHPNGSVHKAMSDLRSALKAGLAG